MSASTLHPPDGYSLHDAASIIGVSLNTLRKRIATGQVKAERVQRPQGHVWRVYLDVEHPVSHPVDQPSTLQAAAPSSTVQAELMALLIRETITSVLEPLREDLAVLRQDNARLSDQLMSQAEQIGQLREDRGRLTAELERAAATVVSLSNVLDAHTAPESAPAASEPAPARWRSWWPALLALAALLLSGVALVGSR